MLSFEYCSRADVYIDPSTGTPTQNGTIDAPYDSWSDVVWAANTTYRQREGTTYVNTIRVDVPNTTTFNGTITSYKAMPEDSGRPIIHGLIPVEGTWTQRADATYYATQTTTFTFNNANMWADQVEINRTAAATTTPSNASWSTVSNVIYLNVGTYTFSIGTSTFERSNSTINTGIYLWDSNCSVVGMQVEWTPFSGITGLSTSDNIYIYDCVVEHCGQNQYTSGQNCIQGLGNNCYIGSCTARYAGDNGIAHENLEGTGNERPTNTGNVVENCESSFNWNVGITVKGEGPLCNSAIIRNNNVHDNGLLSTDLNQDIDYNRCGIRLQNFFGTVTGNTIYRNGGAGIYSLGSTNTAYTDPQITTIEYNDVYNNYLEQSSGYGNNLPPTDYHRGDRGGIALITRYVTADINSYFSLSNNTVHEMGTGSVALYYFSLSTFSAVSPVKAYNNIFISEGTYSVHRDKSDFSTGSDFDNNVLNSNSLVSSDRGIDETFATWNAKSYVGTDLQFDPGWVGSSTYNHNLVSSSPIRNIGIEIGTRITDVLGNPLSGIRDIGAFEYQPVGSTFSGGASTFSGNTSTFTD